MSSCFLKRSRPLLAIAQSRLSQGLFRARLCSKSTHVGEVKAVASSSNKSGLIKTFRADGPASSFSRFWDSFCYNMGQDLCGGSSRARENQKRIYENFWFSIEKVDKFVFTASLSRRFTIIGGIYTFGLISMMVYERLVGVETEEKIMDEVQVGMESLGDLKVRIQAITDQVHQCVVIRFGSLTGEDKKDVEEAIELLEEILQKPRGEEEKLHDWKNDCLVKLDKIKSILNPKDGKKVRSKEVGPDAAAEN